MGIPSKSTQLLMTPLSGNKRKFWVKFVFTVLVVLILSSIQFLQKYGWNEAIGRTLQFKEVLLVYLGYGLLGLLSALIYLFHKRFKLERDQIVKSLIIHAGVSVFFSFLHSLFFSIVYYIIEPIWQGYPFRLLYKDVLFNYLNVGLIFYWVAIIFSEAYNGFFVLKTQSFEPNSEATLAIKDQGNTHLLKVNEIQYVLSADNYVKVCLTEKKVMTRESMTNLERKLNPEHFLRIHRTALVNRAFISEINRTPTGEINLVMNDSTVLPMSRRRKEVKALLATLAVN